MLGKKAEAIQVQNVTPQLLSCGGYQTWGSYDEG